MFVHVFFVNRQKAEHARIRGEMEDRSRVILRGAEELERCLVQRLVEGAEMGTAIDEFQERRADFLTIERSARPWDWGDDDLRRWRQKELTAALQEANRRLLVPWVASFLLVVGVSAALCTVLYNFGAGQRLGAGAGAPPRMADEPQCTETACPRHGAAAPAEFHLARRNKRDRDERGRRGAVT